MTEPAKLPVCPAKTQIRLVSSPCGEVVGLTPGFSLTNETLSNGHSCPNMTFAVVARRLNTNKQISLGICL